MVRKGASNDVSAVNRGSKAVSILKIIYISMICYIFSLGEVNFLSQQQNTFMQHTDCSRNTKYS